MTKTTSAASSATADPWLIRIYSDENCIGSHYAVQGYNEHVTNECLNLHGGLATSSSGDEPTCRGFPEDGDGEWKSCDESSLKSPQLWNVESGSCAVSDNDTCKSDGYGQVYSWDKKGCQNMNDSKFNPKTRAALECSRKSRAVRWGSEIIGKILSRVIMGYLFEYLSRCFVGHVLWTYIIQ
jgi:hypothetical protein